MKGGRTADLPYVINSAHFCISLHVSYSYKIRICMVCDTLLDNVLNFKYVVRTKVFALFVTSVDEFRACPLDRIS